MLLVFRSLVPLAIAGYAVWWIFDMSAWYDRFGVCPACRACKAWKKTGRLREKSRDHRYQREHLWTIKQTEWRCIECHYTTWHPGSSKADNNWVN